MAILTAVLPCADAIAAYLSLQRAAETQAHQAEKTRSRSQLAADLLTERLTGRTITTRYDVRINLVMDTDSLLAGGTTPARMDGYGPISADLARQLVTTAHQATLRRLFTTPDEPDLVRMESTTRTFTGLLRELITLRDDTCRTPWCEAPIRHIDHITPWAHGGTTSYTNSYTNSQGLCETCNYTKEHPTGNTPPPPRPHSPAPDDAPTPRTTSRKDRHQNPDRPARTGDQNLNSPPTYSGGVINGECGCRTVISM